MTILILCLALFLRTFAWLKTPPSLYGDEVSLIYDAWSIAETGADHHGHPWPLVAFESYGDFKPSGYFYALVPWLKIFGPRDFVVKIPSLLAGLAIVLGVGCLFKLMFGTFKDQKSQKILHFGPQLVMLLAAVNPSLVHLSRVGFETNLALALLLWGMICLWPRAPDKKLLNWRWLLGALLLVASFYTYHATRVVAPLIGIYLFTWQLIILLRTPRHSQSLIKYLLVNIGLLITILGATLWPFVASLRSEALTSRFNQTSIFTDLSIVQASNNCRINFPQPQLARFVCHRYLFYGQRIGQNLLRNLDPIYLFFTGDGNRRHSTGLFGIFYPLDAILFIFGLIWWIKNWRRFWPMGTFCLFWLVVGLIPVSLTLDQQHLLRSLTVLPVFLLTFTLGWQVLADTLPKRRVILLLALIYLGLVVRFQSYYHTTYRRDSSSDWWQYGYEQAIAALDSLQQKYPQLPVYFTRKSGRPSMYYFWYKKIPPAQVQQADTQETKAAAVNNEFITYSPDQVTFATPPPAHSQLVVLTPEELSSLPTAATLSETTEIANLAGATVFIVGKLD